MIKTYMDSGFFKKVKASLYSMVKNEPSYFEGMASFTIFETEHK